MKQYFETLYDAKIARNKLLDESLFATSQEFRARYGDGVAHAWHEYREGLYAALDAVKAYPAEVDWPELPQPPLVPQYPEPQKPEV